VETKRSGEPWCSAARKLSRSPLAGWLPALLLAVAAPLAAQDEPAAYDIVVSMTPTASQIAVDAGVELPARLAGYSRRDSALVGIGMCARGEIEIVVISIALEAGLISRVGVADPVSRYLFSALVLMAVVTTFVTPLLLRLALRGQAPPATT